MRKASLTFLLVAVAAAVAVVQAAGPKGLSWQTDLNEAHRLSIESDKPMVLVFGAEWCHYCKKMDRTTLTNPDLVRYIETNFVPVHIDADEQKRVAEILEVGSLPCTVILSPDADLLGRFEGFKPASGFYEELVKAKRAHGSRNPVQTASRTTTARKAPR